MSAPVQSPAETRTSAAGSGAASGGAHSSPVARPWLTVALREMAVKLTDRNYIIGIVVTVAMIAGASVFSAWMNSRTAEYEVAVAGAEEATVAQAGEAFLGEDDVITVIDSGSPEAARQAVEDGEAEAALIHDGQDWTLTGLSDVPENLRAALTQAVSAETMAANAAAAGTTVDELTAGSELTVDLLESDSEDPFIARIVGFAFAFLFYMAAIMFGMTIATSVLEEKQNRVVEILATAVPIRHLLMGKVIGNSVLAFAQIIIFAATGLLALTFTDLVADIGFILTSAGWFMVFFAVGFFALAAVWGVLGSMASRTEDLNSNSTPVMMVIFLATFIGAFASGTILTVASYVPLVSTTAMPIRMLSESVPLWQVLLVLAGNVLTAYLLVRLAAAVYQRAVLQSGTALGWRQALRVET